MSLDKIKNLVSLNGYEFININSTSSTMDEAKKYLKKNNKNCIILANHQTKGRGRRNNLWESPYGNIYCSISFNNFLKVEENFLFSVLVAVSIKQSLENFKAKNIKFKWPNDIYHKNKKFAGIIAETFQVSNLKKFIVLGFGININSSPKIKNYPTTFVNSFCKFNDFYDYLLIYFRLIFINLNNLISNKSRNLINEYKKNLLFLNTKIKVKLNDNSLLIGKFIGINNNGALILKKDNEIIKLYNGSIIL